MATCRGISIERRNGTRVLVAKWYWCTLGTAYGKKWDAHTDGYKVRWWVKYRKSATKVLANEATVEYDHTHTKDIKKTFSGKSYFGQMAEFTMPDDITAVWFKVLPYTDQEDEQEHYNGKKNKVDWSTALKWTDVTDAPKGDYAITIATEQATGNDQSRYKVVASIDGIDTQDLLWSTKVTETSKWEGKITWRFYREDAELPESAGKRETSITSSTQTKATASIWADTGCAYKVRYRVNRTHYTRKQVEKTVKGVTTTSYSDWEAVESKNSAWSAFSSIVEMVPAKPSGFTKYKAWSTTSVFLEWQRLDHVNQYKIEYISNVEAEGHAVTHALFNRLLNEKRVKEQTTEHTSYTTTIGELTAGRVYYFRLKGVNKAGESYPADTIVSVILGVAPAAPTTWSNKTVLATDDSLRLYWTHNAKDESAQTGAQIERTVTLAAGGSTTKTDTKTYTPDPNRDSETYFVDYTASALGITGDAEVKWRVRTKGVLDAWGDWSTPRTVKVFETPRLSVGLSDSEGSVAEGEVTAFPLHLSTALTPATQKPVGYHVAIRAVDTYQTYDAAGNFKAVNAGETVFERYFDSSEALRFDFTPADVTFENGESYILSAMCSTDAGLSTEETVVAFTVAWPTVDYNLTAAVLVDPATLTASIRPFCVNEDDEPVDAELLYSVYRRETDGSFTAIALDFEPNTYVVDPHPALDYARYRVVAKTTTGNILFADPSNEPVQEKSAVLQWDEDVNDFSAEIVDAMEEQEWTGSMLKLPYNLEVSEKAAPDVEKAAYIGREHPVSYYGTQRGYTADWSLAIYRQDAETLYALRRLQRWMGDVYVREPSGSGYWAQVTVSIKQQYNSTVVPVTLSITRVEGGA